MGKGILRTHNVLARHAVNAVTGGMSKAAHLGAWLTCQPDGKKGRNHAIADGKLLNALAYLFDHARAIGQQNTAILSRELAAGNNQIMKVQRAGFNRNPNFTLAGSARIGDI